MGVLLEYWEILDNAKKILGNFGRIGELVEYTGEFWGIQEEFWENSKNFFKNSGKFWENAG